MITGGMNASSLAKAKLEVYQICQSGQTITLEKPKIGYVDEGGSATDWDTMSFGTHPVRFAPFDRKVVNKIAWSENVSIIFYCSVLELELKTPATTIEDLKSYNKINYSGKIYNLKYVEFLNAFGTSFLGFVIGGVIES